MRRRQEKEGAFDFYEGVTPPLWEPFSYHYEIYEEKDYTENADSESIRYFNRLGLVAEADPAFDFCRIASAEETHGQMCRPVSSAISRGVRASTVRTGRRCRIPGM